MLTLVSLCEVLVLLISLKKRTYFSTTALSINLEDENTTGIYGKNGTELTCVYIKERGDRILTLFLSATNKSTNKLQDIAVFRPNVPSSLTLPYGAYLVGRVSLTNITDSSSEAKIIFHEIDCVDGTEYKCRATYLNSNNKQNTLESNNSRISVQVLPSNPELIKYSSTIQDGSNQTFTCSGNIGNPPETYIWQHCSKDNSLIIEFSNISIVMEEVPEMCSYKGISNLTVKITAEDNQSKFRCFAASTKETFIETELLNVYFEVRTPEISKFPSQEVYAEETDIALICSSTGNPEPKYTWMKNNSNIVLSERNVFEIKQAKAEDSGLYLCNVSNSFHGTTYKLSSSVYILIEVMEKENDVLDKNAAEAPVIAGITISVVICFATVIVIIVLMVKKIRLSKRQEKVRTKQNESQKNNDSFGLDNEGVDQSQSNQVATNSNLDMLNESTIYHTIDYSSIDMHQQFPLNSRAMDSKKVYENKGNGNSEFANFAVNSDEEQQHSITKTDLDDIDIVDSDEYRESQFSSSVTDMKNVIETDEKSSSKQLPLEINTVTDNTIIKDDNKKNTTDLYERLRSASGQHYYDELMDNTFF